MVRPLSAVPLQYEWSDSNMAAVLHSAFHSLLAQMYCDPREKGSHKIHFMFKLFNTVQNITMYFKI
jgi:hypothetical protein